MITELIRRVVEGNDLTVAESAAAMNAIMSGECTPAQVSAFIVALRMKGETIEEIAGCARVMREKAVRVDPGPSAYEIVDTCGTGGDTKHTFNISTTAALIAAGAGVTVAKHGNRAVSSKSGSADVLKMLGVNLEAGKGAVEKALREARIGFLFAPMMHGAMKYAIGPRREIGVRTVFNILGPLTNPAGAACQVLGVFDAALVEPMAGVLRELGGKHCMVVHGDDGLDEMTTTGATRVAELKDGHVTTYALTPEDAGVSRAKLADLVAIEPADAVRAVRAVLAGTKSPHRDIAVLNAGAAIYVAGAAADLEAGIALACEAVDSGAAQAALDKLVAITNG
jgi:anthranilate phosphoribosyltransferase